MAGRSQEIIAIIHEAIDEANEVRPRNEWIPKNTDEPLVGPDSKLDSLTLLNLVVAIEERVNARYNSSVDLAGMLALDPATTPLRTVATLTTMLDERIGA